MTNSRNGHGDGDAPRAISLLHTSDLHFLDDLARARTVGSLFPTIAAAVERLGADGLLLAGDIFDTPNVPLSEVADLLGSLERLGVPAVLLPGNHDAQVFLSTQDLEWPPGVYLIRRWEGESVHVPELGLTVWGRPTYDHTPRFRPLEGLPPRPQSGWYVAMAHGLVLEDPGFKDRSSLIMEEELVRAECDYIALGHVHAFRDVTKGQAPAYYSGAPWGATTTPTAALVSLRPGSPASVRPVLMPLG